MKIAVIGTGNMGGALMDAFCKDAENHMTAYNHTPEKLAAVCAHTGARAAASTAEAVEDSDLILLAVKPIVMPAVLEELKSLVTDRQIIVSIAVGLTLESYGEVLGFDKKLVRAMPNTPSAVQAGMTAFTFGEHVTEEEQQAVLKLFSLAGGTAVLPERLMNAVSALTGSSPAYVYMFIEAMADAGVYAGIPRAQAYQLSAQAVLGAAKMVLESGKHPGQLKDEVCSPGGTTIRAVAELEQRGMRSAVIEAIKSCVDAAAGTGK